MDSETRYARSGDVSIAYQMTGEGPFDLVLVPPATSHVELAWDVPVLRTMYERFASFARLIHFDRRQTLTRYADAARSASPSRMYRVAPTER